MIAKIGAVALAVSLAAAAMVGAAAQDNPDLGASKPPAPPPQIAPAPEVEARYAAIEKSGKLGEALVVFDRRLADQQISELFSRSGVRPYALHMYMEGMTGLHQVPVNNASLDIIPAARKKSADMQTKAIKGARRRADEVLELRRQGSGRGADDERVKAILTGIEQSENLGEQARRGTPLIFAARVVGTAAQLRSLAGQPRVAELIPGYEVRGRIILPAPTAPSDSRGHFSAPAIEALSGAALETRLRETARAATESNR